MLNPSKTPPVLHLRHPTYPDCGPYLAGVDRHTWPAATIADRNIVLALPDRAEPRSQGSPSRTQMLPGPGTAGNISGNKTAAAAEMTTWVKNNKTPAAQLRQIGTGNEKKTTRFSGGCIRVRRRPGESGSGRSGRDAVSYTHLTLPTKA